MKILGYEVIKVIEGRDIFKEHPESEFFVNDTEMLYIPRDLHSDFSDGEIEKSKFYLITDMRKEEVRMRESWEVEEIKDETKELFDGYVETDGEEQTINLIKVVYIPNLDRKVRAGEISEWQREELHKFALELIEDYSGM